uniref:Uncharacterized protein n=1 Tax=Knipowitschia caucasica TaxID=637954 RepID=A0AAV2JXI8_KNICA
MCSYFEIPRLSVVLPSEPRRSNSAENSQSEIYKVHLQNGVHLLYKTDTHTPSHHLEPVQRSEPFLDRDYCLPPSGAGYNYLDPNYFPSNR